MSVILAGSILSFLVVAVAVLVTWWVFLARHGRMKSVNMGPLVWELVGTFE